MFPDKAHPLDPDWDVVGCPECHAPAEVLERFHVAGTTDWIEHVKVRCAWRHWFMMLADCLPSFTAALSGPSGSDGSSPATGAFFSSPRAPVRCRERSASSVVPAAPRGPSSAPPPGHRD